MERRRTPKAGPMNVAAAFATALLVSVAFCQSALGQTHLAINVITLPGDGSAPDVGSTPLDGAPPCTATFCKSIRRYENKFILAIAEYETIPPCKYIDHGQWKPGTNIQPTSAGKPAGTVDLSQPPFIGPTPPGCSSGGGPYFYAPIDFDWTLRKNSTAVPGYGPTATFNSAWFTTDGMYYLPYTFQVTVPVVRPMGETTEWSGFAFDFSGPGMVPVGQWQQTLVPKPADAPFDFSGEEVKEHFVNTIIGCQAPKFNMGTQGASTSTGSSWPVTAMNKWGPDGVGFGGEPDALCAMHYARCVQPTGCANIYFQQMGIKSPADMDYTDYGNVNILLVGVTGGVIPTGQGLGFVSSARAGQGPKSEYYVTQGYNCAPYLKKQFPKCK